MLAARPLSLYASAICLWLASPILAISLSKCSSQDISLPDLPGVTKLSVTAERLENFHIVAEDANPERQYDVSLNFCNVTINYAHQGWRDNVQVTVWLPLKGWNGRLSGIGGAGLSSLWTDNRFAPAVSRGYAAVGTDAGHARNPIDATSWALDAAGNVNFFLVQNFFALSQNEAAIIAKKVIADLYGQGPRYSYWDGCSTGGRQGLMLAQRYPAAYDGILAGAPAINWATFVPGMYYPKFVMDQEGHQLSQCAFDAIRNATVKACDGLDGVEDGIISALDQCDFDPRSLVGKKFDCNGEAIKIAAKDAAIVQKFWDGPKQRDGSFMWYGMSKGVELKGLGGAPCTLAECAGVPFQIASDWIKLFVLQDPNLDLSTLSPEGYEAAVNLSVNAYRSVASNDNPDLTEFRQAGGKLLHWHGTDDQQIYAKGSENYYNKVEARHASVRDFYRFFFAPGVAHCGYGHGLLPEDPFSALIDWVEDGKAPDTLSAATADGSYRRNLCPYPQVPAYRGGDPAKASSFHCQDSYENPDLKDEL
ncbi:feruloyl esterase, putative [Metarhizium acridum CQMa 102]|uniref:Carboxylic ester hydrolase n=1 Tax=Metarhizium acridum (strain CQMa 102) TaxID=655827 RepID=E9DQX1_METAQ|nr:feruloyl esterase, putative [Metarhizium acridum CQMa 102]EFY93649.1 feruloyl esterase, putative [Metarhizium acridum CQMa 102]